jgi:biotin carboxyl carrier protein
MAREKTERPGDAATDTPRASLSVAELRQLITLMNGSDIEEIGIEEKGGLRLSLRKPALLASPGHSEDEAYDGAAADGATPEPKSTTVEVTSPLVGQFRVSMKPGGQSLCSLGDIVREGQVICAVESLSVPNEVEAPIAGRIVAIYLGDGRPVEYGQPLMAIEPQV